MSISRPTTTRLVTGLLVLPLFAVSVQAGDVTVESLRDRNRQNLENVRSIVLEERVDLRSTIPVEARRAQEAVAIEESRAWLLKVAAATGASAERIQELNDQSDQRYANFEESIIIEQLNATSTVRRTTTIDRAHRRVRRDDVDPRDLARMAREHHLGQGRLMSLDRTCSLISQIGKPEIQLNTPRVGKLATIMPMSQISFDQEEARLGVLPVYLFNADFSLKARALDAAQFKIIAEYRSSGRTAFEAIVDAEKGYALTELRGFNADGELVEVFMASNFRHIDDVWLPFETRSEYPSTPMTPTVIERHVRTTKFNPAISDKLFAPPGDYRVIDLTGTDQPEKPPGRPAKSDR